VLLFLVHRVAKIRSYTGTRIFMVYRKIAGVGDEAQFMCFFM
jgi:hypothetical protein